MLLTAIAVVPRASRSSLKVSVALFLPWQLPWAGREVCRQLWPCSGAIRKTDTSLTEHQEAFIQPLASGSP